ncbi:MAG: DUF2536 family protein [Bacillus sp. (in: firmicutes)]
MNISFDLIEDKVEFFEATTLQDLEKKIQAQIDINKTILLTVHSVSHQLHVSEDGRKLYSAVVHFKNKKA